MFLLGLYHNVLGYAISYLYYIVFHYIILSLQQVRPRRLSSARRVGTRVAVFRAEVLHWPLKRVGLNG